MTHQAPTLNSRSRSVPTVHLRSAGLLRLREFRGTSYRDIGGFHDNVYALDLLADDDVLFVGSQEDQIVMFTQASTLTGEVEPAMRHTPEDLLQNFAIWRAR